MPFSALNGHLPASMLVALPWPEASSQRLRPDAAASLGRLAAVFLKDFGRPLLITDSYRSFDAQVRTKAAKGIFAATPGTSNHGLGIAVDLSSGINSSASTTHRWMEVNGPGFGWTNPLWARDANPVNGQFEPWHWEYDYRTDRSAFAQATPTTEDDMTPDQDARLARIEALLLVPGQPFGFLSPMNDKLDALKVSTDDTHRRIRGPESQPYDEIQALRAHLTAALDALGKIGTGTPDASAAANTVLDALAARLRA